MTARSLVRMSVIGTSAALLAGGLAAASPAGAATPAAPTQASCSTGHLPAAVLGDPVLRSGQTTGTYIAHGTGSGSERSGYGLAVTHPGSRAAIFTGTVRATSPITAVRVHDERHDVIRLSADHKTMTYRFVNFGHIDAVAFRADCAKTVTFTMAVNGHRLPPANVFLGAHRVHPTSVPFTIERS